MGLFEQFPYANFHELNLDWLLTVVKSLDKRLEAIEETDLEQYVYNAIDRLVDDGTLAAIVAQYFDYYITPEMFGAVGDGVTDDTAAFNAMLQQQDGHTAVLLSGNYRLTGLVSEDIKLPMIGTKPGASIETAGPITYANADIENLTIITAGTDGIIFNNDFADTVTVKNCVFRNSAATQLSRGGTALRSRARRVIVENCAFSGFISGVVFNYSAVVTGTDFVTIRSIYGYNIETLVDVEGTVASPYTTKIDNVTIENVVLANDATIRASIVGTVGKDAVLAGGIRNLIINNVLSSYAKERAVYMNNSDNVSISNVVSDGSECLKIAGTTVGGVRTPSRKVSASNIHAYNPYSGFLAYIYDAEDVTLTDVSMMGDGTDQDTQPAIMIERYVHDLVIDGVNIRDVSRGVFLCNDSAGYTADIRNITVKNIVADNWALRTGVAAFRFLQSTTAYNIIVEGFKSNAEGAPYYAYSGDAGLFTLNNVNACYIGNITRRWAGSLANPFTLNNCDNVIVRADDIAYPSAYNSESLPIRYDSDLRMFTMSEAAATTYHVERRYDPLRLGATVSVKLPSSAQAYGSSNNRTLIIEGPRSGRVDIVNGTATVAGTGLSFAGGVLSSDMPGWYRVTVIEQ